MAQQAGVYVDGFNLFHGMKEGGLKHCYWLNIEALAEQLMHPRSEVKFVYYFTARVSHDQSAAAKQSVYLDALGTLPKVHIITGHFKAGEQKCPACQTLFQSYREKKSDVNIACTMLRHALQGEIDVALLITGDSDLVPALQTVGILAPQVVRIVAFPPERGGASQLSRESSKSLLLKEADLVAAQLPDPVVDATGHPLSKPATWS